MTGRNNCSPEWQQALIELVALLTTVLAGQGFSAGRTGCAAVQPMPLCDGNNKVVGYVVLKLDGG